MTTNDGERWLPVLGWEGFYEISDHGRGRSCDRVITTSTSARRYRGRMLRPSINNNGYWFVILSRPGQKRTARLHSLVLESFVGPPPQGMWCCHGLGGPLDNRLSNLRWDTPSENNYDLVRHGTHWQAAKTHCQSAHPLVAPNLVPSQLPYRICLACDRARSNRKHARKIGAAFDFRSTADAHYARIVGASDG